MQNIFKVIGLIVLSLVVVACDTSINIEDGELVVNSTFSVSEELLNSGESTALNFGDVDLIENANYDIQEGQIVVSGDLLCESGSRQEGSIAIAISTTEDGFIDVEMSDVESDCDGVESSLITEAQEELASSLSEAAKELQESEASLEFTEITLEDDSLTIGFEVRAPINSD